MKNTNTFVSCPECNHSFDVSEVMHQQLHKQVEQALAERKKQLEAGYHQRENELLNLKNQLDAKEGNIDQLVQQRLKEEEKDFRQKIRQEVEADKTQEMTYLQEELVKKKEEIGKMRALQFQVKQLEEEKEDMAHQLKMEYEEKRLTDRKNIEEQIRSSLETQNQLKLQEKDLQLKSLEKQVNEMKRKMEQGSVQLQGEAQEVLIETTLRNLFPLDDIREVPKGRNGADAIQVVMSKSLNEAGKILYESKRTKAFNKDWLEKIRQDQLRENAHIAVLITEALPEGVDRIECIQGVWVCDYPSFPGLARAMRELVLQVDAATDSQVNKGEKMAMLYDYLTSQEFRMHVEAIIKGFHDIKENTTRQRLVMERYWKTNEKIAERVMLNTTHMYSAIKGIAGSSVLEVKALEEPENDDHVSDLSE